MGRFTLGCNQQDLWNAVKGLWDQKPACMVPMRRGGNKYGAVKPTFRIAVVDGESVQRSRQAALHYFVVNG